MFDPESPVGSSAVPEALQNGATSNVASAGYPFRLLSDEEVLGVFPVARADRPLGKLASFLFVTDSRLVYAAEAKTISSSSIHNKEFHIQKIEGLEVSRHTGYDALGLVALIGSALNFVLLLIAGLTVTGATSTFSGYMGGSSNPFEWLSILFVPFAVASLVIGIVVAFTFRTPSASIKVVGPDKAQTLSHERDLPMLLVVLMLFLVFGFFSGIALLIWVAVRELGVFRAVDAQNFAPIANVDRVAFDAGALILDVQSRGRLADRI